MLTTVRYRISPYFPYRHFTGGTRKPRGEALPNKEMGTFSSNHLRAASCDLYTVHAFEVNGNSSSIPVEIAK